MKMGIFRKQNVPATATSHAEGSVNLGSDPEKAHSGSVMDAAISGLPQNHHPDVERRLLRKMDRRVPWLVAALYLMAFLGRF